MHLQNEEILALKWRDKQDVYVLSSIQAGLVQKPDCIHYYKQFMGGADYNDKPEPVTDTQNCPYTVLVPISQLQLLRHLL